MSQEYYDSIYFCGDGTKDWMAKIIREEDGGPWVLEYRFRYYKSEEAFDGKDEKNWYRMKARDASQESLDEGRKVIRSLFPSISKHFGGSDVDVVEMQCYSDDPKFFFELTSRPWANVKYVPAVECDLCGTRHSKDDPCPNAKCANHLLAEPLAEKNG